MSDTVQSTNAYGSYDVSLSGNTVTFDELFTPNIAVAFAALESVQGFPFGSTISLVPETGGGFQVVGSGVFIGIQTGDLFPGYTLSSPVTVTIQEIPNGLGLYFTESATCFTAGVMIETASGPRAVETIEVGDAVWAFGRLAPVTWTGSRRIRVADVARPEMFMPIRIRQGAVAEGLPVRDLVVSPDHAIWIDGKLIPARMLVNGRSIVQDQVAEVTYYHVGLESHDLLLAEGLQVESYLDVAGLLAAEGEGVTALRQLAIELPPAVAVYEAHGYAPLSLASDQVQPVWQSLAERAHSLFVAANDALPAPAQPAEPSFDIVVDGDTYHAVLVATESGASIFRCSLPGGARSLTITSQASSPWSSRPWLEDRRLLGVAISSARVLHDDVMTELSLVGPAFGNGWYAPEQGAVPFRWTNGAATLHVPAGASSIELSVVAIASVDRIAAAA
ncbi:Hint domain-containing protein [Lichenicola sp.]|uniref:Hint domain-containing protein n=1 Tax=Lichenicola sp. TaxID=2804529 RepID=UPI003AFF8465